MREIKFRAWNNKIKNMEPVLSIDFERGTLQYKTYPETASDEDLSWNKLSDVVLMRYTGLKDKNGVEIYEGDIVRKLLTSDGDEFPLSNLSIEANVAVEYKQPSFILDTGSHWLPLNSGCEVTGNIYENPELLKNG